MWHDKGTVAPNNHTMDHHSQLLRSLLALLASKQAIADDGNGTIAAEFLVSLSGVVFNDY